MLADLPGNLDSDKKVGQCLAAGNPADSIAASIVLT